MKRSLAAISVALMCLSSAAVGGVRDFDITPIWLRPSWVPVAVPLPPAITPPFALSDFELVNKPCYGPIPLPTPPLQQAFTGVYESLSISGDQVDWIAGGGNEVQINLRLGVGTFSSSVFDLAGVESERIVPLFAPGTGNPVQVGLMKVCSPTFNFCRELLIRAVVNGQVVVPGNGLDIQRFVALNPAGSVCEGVQ